MYKNDVICMCCETKIGETFTAIDAVSHGICPVCRDKMIAQIRK